MSIFLKLTVGFLLPISLMSIFAFAEESKELSSTGDVEMTSLEDGLGVHFLKGKMKKRRKFCRKAKLTADQKLAIQEAVKEFRLETKSLRQSLRVEKQKYKALLENPAATSAEAEEITEKIVDLRGEIMIFRTDLKNDILFNIAEVEQRKPLVRCMKRKRLRKMKRRMKRKRSKKHKKKKETPRKTQTHQPL